MAYEVFKFYNIDCYPQHIATLIYDSYPIFSDLTEMAYEVFKEMLSEFLFGTVGSFFGIENRRTENVGMFERIVGAIRKHTIHKKMGCP